MNPRRRRRQTRHRRAAARDTGIPRLQSWEDVKRLKSIERKDSSYSILVYECEQSEAGTVLDFEVRLRVVENALGGPLVQFMGIDGLDMEGGSVEECFGEISRIMGRVASGLTEGSSFSIPLRIELQE